MISVSSLLLALAAGAGGAVLAKLMEGRFQRAQSLRAWRLAAADDYTTGVHQAMIALRNAHTTLLNEGTARADGHIEIRDLATDKVRPEIEKALDASRESVDVVVSRLGRIHILFGDSTLAGKAATSALESLRVADEALRDWPVPDLATFASGRDRAVVLHGEFNRAALETLQATTMRARIRRAISPKQQALPE